MTLSCAEAAEIIGQVAMELEGIQGAFNRTRNTLALFTAHANGKHCVTLRASSWTPLGCNKNNKNPPFVWLVAPIPAPAPAPLNNKKFIIKMYIYSAPHNI